MYTSLPDSLTSPRDRFIMSTDKVSWNAVLGHMRKACQVNRKQRLLLAPSNKNTHVDSCGNDSSVDVSVDIMLHDMGVEAFQIKCDECDRRFVSQIASRPHRWHKHGYINPTFAKMVTTYCLSCATEFHTEAGLFAHVAYRASRCNSFYLEQAEDLCLIYMMAESLCFVCLHA